MFLLKTTDKNENLKLFTTLCDGNSRSLKPEKEPSALSHFFPWSCTPMRGWGEGWAFPCWWSCKPRALAALWTLKMRSMGRGRPQNSKMLGVESLGAEPSLSGGLSWDTWRRYPPENWDKESRGWGLWSWKRKCVKSLTWSGACALDCSRLQRLHACIWHTALHWTCRLKPLQLPRSGLKTHTTQDFHQEPDSSVTLSSSWRFHIQACILKATV